MSHLNTGAQLGQRFVLVSLSFKLAVKRLLQAHAAVLMLNDLRSSSLGLLQGRSRGSADNFIFGHIKP